MAIQRIDECGDVSVLWIDRKGVSYPVLVDTEDVERILSFPGSWCISPQNYVVADTRGVGRLRVKVLMHRFLLDAVGSLVVDHRYRDTLDNRKHRLRQLTNQQNMLNRRGPASQSTSGVRGVTWDKRSGRWKAQIQICGKCHHLGYFSDKFEAASAARTAQEQAA